jgi:hypothetical protein
MPVSINGSGSIAGVPGSILQVVSALKQDTFTTTSTSYTDVTGLSVSITPRSSSSKMLVMVSIPLGNSTLNGYFSRGQIVRDTTVIGAGSPSGNRPAGSFAYIFTGSSTLGIPTQFMTVLDSPGTSSQITYKVQVATESGGTATVNWSNTGDANVAQAPRLASSITIMEVAS